MNSLPRWLVVLFVIVLLTCLGLMGTYFFLQKEKARSPVIELSELQESPQETPSRFDLKVIPDDDFNEVFISGYVGKVYEEIEGLFVDLTVPYHQEDINLKVYLGEVDDRILVKGLVGRDEKKLGTPSSEVDDIEALALLDLKENFIVGEEIKLAILVPKSEILKGVCLEPCQEKMSFYKEHKADFDLLLNLVENKEVEVSQALVIGPAVYIMFSR